MLMAVSCLSPVIIHTRMPASISVWIASGTPSCATTYRVLEWLAEVSKQGLDDRAYLSMDTCMSAFANV